MAHRNNVLLNFGALLCLLVTSVLTLAQISGEKKLQAKAIEKDPSKVSETESLKAQRRVFAISLITSLADEARSYRDQALRPHVLARAADALWDANSDTARSLFRRAWEAAEKGDAEEGTLKSLDAGSPTATAMVTALYRISGRDLRAEVLSLAARRDRALGEEFLKKLVEQTKRESADSKTDPGSRTSDSWSSSEADSRRIQLARNLLANGEVDRALEFAAPVLDKVNVSSISFLSALRAARPTAADQRFAFLMSRAQFDPLSDANTASGLSSYVFTPGLYVTFSADGQTRWSQPDDPSPPPNLPPALRNEFFQAAASILLRPLPPADQDFTSSGRAGKYLVITRLLPLFDQYAPDTASALRTQLSGLVGDGSPKATGNNNNPLLSQGLQPEDSASNVSEKMQDRLDHAKTSRERDSIYEDAAVALATQGEARAQDVTDKIDDSKLREHVRQYVDFELVRFAIRKKEAAEVVRLAKAGQLTHTQRAWAYTQAARLLMDSQRQQSVEFLDEALDEARRIDSDDPDRACLLIGVATQFVTTDRVRAWETMAEAVKAANSTEKFNGEDVQLHFPLMTKSGLKITNIGGEDFGLSGVLRSLTKEDLYRSIELAKRFKSDAPRAAAILAIGSAVLEK